MNTEFNYITNCLENNEHIFIEILDYNNGNTIVTKNQVLTGAKMIEKSGGIENWFIEEIKKKGYKKIQVQLFKKQGTAKIREGRAYNFGFEEESQENGTIQPLVQTILERPQIGLTGGLQGLGFSDVVDLHVTKDNYQRVIQEHQIEKQKNEHLENRVKSLEEEKRNLERKTDTREFWGGLVKESIPMLAQGLSAFAPQPGLNAPVQEKEIPDGIKGGLIHLIKNAPLITEEQGMAAYNVLEAYTAGNKELIQELQQLLHKHGKDNHTER